MDADIEPASFDLVVVGTGLPESILAGAAAQAGKSVLHLDPADSYGSHWATLQLEAVLGWAKRGGTLTQTEGLEEQPASSATSCPPPGEAPTLEAVPLRPSLPLYSDFTLHSEDGTSSPKVLPSRVANSRAYGIDLAGPRLALAAGPLVDLLVRCGGHHYLEFKAVEASYIWHAGKLEPVPASRADVFKSRSLSLVEKRHLTRFFQLVTEGSGEGDIPEEDLHMPFVDFLIKHKLPPSVKQSILYCIALLEYDQDSASLPCTTAREGVQALKRYLQSVGRFGSKVGAFLYPLYGCGELSQAFCRIAAVKGALYVLRRGVRSLLLDQASSHFRGIVTSTGQSIFASKLVTAPGLVTLSNNNIAALQSEEPSTAKYSIQTDAPSGEQSIARCICIVDASLTAGQTNILAVFGPRSLNDVEPSNPVRVLQAGETASVSPTGRYVVQMSMVGSSGRSAEDELKPIVEALLETKSDTVRSGKPGIDFEDRASDTPSQAQPISVNTPGEPSQTDSTENSTVFQVTEASSLDAETSGGAIKGEESESGPPAEPVESVDPPSSSHPAEVRKPRLLWAVYFKQRVDRLRKILSGDVLVTGSPDGGLTYSSLTTGVEAAFQRLFPGLPFFPPDEVPEESQEGEAQLEEGST